MRKKNDPFELLCGVIADRCAVMMLIPSRDDEALNERRAGGAPSPVNHCRRVASPAGRCQTTSTGSPLPGAGTASYRSSCEPASRAAAGGMLTPVPCAGKNGWPS